jgi:hypothetical protein
MIGGRLAGCHSVHVGYYIRFLLEGDRPLSLEEIVAGLHAADPGLHPQQ